MPHPDYLGAQDPKLVLYLPHRPNGLAELVDAPSAEALIAANSNHWRKIITLLAKIASPQADDWRNFRKVELLRQTALCFSAELVSTDGWHWIGGKENLGRFDTLFSNTQPLAGYREVSIDTHKRLLLTPYPDYRQLSNKVVGGVREALERQGFYTETAL